MATIGCSAWLSVAVIWGMGSRPTIENVWLAFLIVRAVGLSLDLEPVSLVETACREIALKRPEAKQRLRRLSKRKQVAAKATALMFWMNVKMIHPTGTKSDEADDSSLTPREPNLSAGKPTVEKNDKSSSGVCRTGMCGMA
jgi:hypothetical protein